MSESTPRDPARPFKEVPRVRPIGGILRVLLGGQSERVDMLSRLRSLHDAHGEVVVQDVGILKMVNLFGPDACRQVLMDRDGIFSSRKPWHQIMGRIFPNGLLLRDGEDHKQHRRIMHEAFRRPVLRDYLERMGPMIESGTAEWGRSDGFLFFDAVKELTLDMAASIFMGLDLGPQTLSMKAAFEDMVAASMSRIKLRIPGLEFYRGLKGREFMTGFLSDLVDKKRVGDGQDMFSLLCRAEDEEGNRLSNQDVIDHMIFLMMAAHDTSTSSLTSMMFELGRHTDWQERVREEALALGKPHLGFEDGEDLRSLTWVVKETIRRYPPLPVIPRVCSEPFEAFGYEIPAGSLVVVSPIHTHHMSEWWSEPFRFDPTRFSPEREETKKHTFMWIPFGGGPHHCLGFKFAEAQIKAIMHQLVLRYRWSVPDGYEMPVQQAPISKPMDGLPLELRPIR